MSIFRKKNVAEEVAQVDASENAIANREVEGLTQRQIVIKRFLHHKAAVISMAILFALILIVFTGSPINIGPIKIPGWWKYQFTDIAPMEPCADGTLGCPTLSLHPKFLGGAGIMIGEHPLGQDDIGHDYLSLVLRGAQRSLMVTFIIGIVAGTIGTVIGAIAGYFSGKVDNVLMRFVDFLITIPSIIIGSDSNPSKQSNSLSNDSILWSKSRKQFRSRAKHARGAVTR